MALEAAKMISNILNFKGTVDKPTRYSCEIQTRYLSLGILTAQLNGIKSSHTKIGKWSKSEIIADIAKDQILRNYANQMTDLGLVWHAEASVMLNVLESLGSHIMPEELMSVYQLAECIPDDLVDDHVDVMECVKTKDGYYCGLQTWFPVTSAIVQEMIPIHYNDIRLMPHCDKEVFISGESDGAIFYLHCDQYNFESEKVPTCEKREIEKECLNSLKTKKIEGIIDNCNFTRAEPQVITRLPDSGILVQGKNVKANKNDHPNFQPIASDTPMLIYSPLDLLIKQDEEEWVIKPSNVTAVFAVIKSALTEDQIKRLERRMLWLDLKGSMNWENIVQIVLVIVAVVGVPATACGVGISLKNKKIIHDLLDRIKIKRKKSEPKSSKEVYKNNKHQLSYLPKH